ncbi:uncharacterized protein C8Q71DRAFT_727728 [Rhodofomes roseus]|uniref:F-box domain-containing protein n=1 Tax=Rhodofomes roseus TaxID=34475 RepID=A0ABQ8K198_9APHY|nr:uncharacterized protein C8Q71DRAFT_727728 [Rhodofomes roseus]KAH9829954.1 hypothetical protein C8Q71DRAFT_727728 [Rhodofomes roseus]
MSRRNVPYRKAFKHMDIHDSASKPFAQTWPMLIPGCMLPQMLHLQLYDLDWTTTIKPHDTFFIHLSSYTSIKYLTLHHCRFHGATDLRRMISALPNLQFLSLLEVTLQHSLMPDLARPRYLTTHHRTLESIQIIAATHSTFSDICGPEHMDIVFRNMLHLIAWYSSITSLVIDLQFFPSLLHLEEYLLHYPCLSSLGVSGDYGSSLDSESAPEDVVPTHAEKSPNCASSRLIWQGGGKLQKSQHVRAACSVCAGVGLKSSIGNAAKVILTPAIQSFGLAPSLANNTSLRRLSMLFDEVIPSSQGIQRILSSMLSDITSIHLQHLICFILIANRDMLPQSDETPLAVTDSIDSISTFHAILSSTTFDGLPVCTSNTGVHIHFHMEEIWDKPAMMSALKTHMIALFAPWLDRRIVELQFVSGGTSWQLVRTVPTSDPRCTYDLVNVLIAS